MGAMLATGRVDRVSFNGNRGTVTLMFWRREDEEAAREEAMRNRGTKTGSSTAAPIPARRF